MMHIAVGNTRYPLHIKEAVHILQIQGNSLKPVGYLHGYGIQFYAAHLLEIGILSDLSAIQPYLPSQP